MAVVLMGALRHADWHILSGHRFRRRASVSSTSQVFRGQTYVVLTDRITGRHLRLTDRARDVWRLLDGQRTLQDLWSTLMHRSAIAPSQGEIVDWVMQLVSSGLILSDHELDPDHLNDRSTRQRAGLIEQRAASPLAIKLRLFDPSPLVRLTWPLVAPIFTLTGGVLVALLLLTALVLAVLNADTLLQSADGALLSQSGFLSLLLVYPVMKALHELAHCYALYRFGGQVREFGVMVLVFFPVPYVEASDATALPDKRARMLVGAAGILAELVMAAIALILWLQIEPGFERAILFNFVLIGSVSTLLFNGNPLLKFDAYFVLADWLEMPNLAQRSGEYLQDRFLSRILGLRHEIEPGPGEARILGLYGTLSVAYRMLLTLTIALVVSSWFFVFGILLAVWAVFMGMVWPLVKLWRKGVRMSKAQNRVRRISIRLGLFLAVVAGLLTLVPLPFSATGDGRIMPLPSAHIASATSGLVGASDLADGVVLVPGQRIVQLENPEQTARLRALEMRIVYLEEGLTRSGLSLSERDRLARELEVARTALATALEQEAALEIVAPLGGRLAWFGGRPPIPGSFVHRGDKIGHVVNPVALEIVTAFPATFSGYADPAAQVRLLLPDGTEIIRPVARSLVIDVGQQVPSELLVSGGGRIPEQPDAPGRAFDTSWLIWATPGEDLTRWAGARVEARIDLGSASAVSQLRFHLQRLFLRVMRV
jgi:putative peptide zinc metalloprotease protein